MPSLKILLKQKNPARGIEANKTTIKKTLEEDFDIAVFPEMFYSGYMIRDEFNISTLDPEFVHEIQKGIGDRMIIFGAPLRDGFLYNSAVAVTEGSIQFYRKMHIPNFGPFEEARYFKRGRSPLTIGFKGFKIGLEICYDLFFEDPIEKGVDLMVNISASPFTSYPYFESMFHARAIEYQSYLAYVNIAGLNRNQVFWGGSRILDPDGRELIKLKKFTEDSGSAVIDSSIIHLSRMKRRVLSEVLDDSEK